jgi:hypothetical protein
MQKITLNNKQFQFVTSENKFVVFIGGLGCGKTFSDSIIVLNNLKLEGSFHLFTAPVNNQLKYITNEMVSIWAGLGIFLNQDYVINQKPPKHWGVEPFSIMNNTGILTTKWGSYMQIKEAHNFNAFRASEFDTITADEIRDFKEGAIEVLIGRLRGQSYKRAGLKHQFKATTTVFDNISQVNSLRDSGAEIIESKTADNILNLPSGYIEYQKQVLDDRTYRREVLGEIIPQSNTIFYNYGEWNYSDVEFDNKKDCVLSFDFNVSPMTCLVFQDNIAVKEFQIFDSNTDDTTFKIAEWLRGENFKGSIEVTGDPSGNSRNTSSPRNNYQIIKENLSSFDVKIKNYIREGVQFGNNCISSAFRTAGGSTKLKINIKQCKQLHNNINIVTYADYEKGDPKNITHNIDALRYYCVHYLPIKSRQIEI